jgi:hypothetical protein
MKKDYMKPEGSVVAIQMNENVAASANGSTPQVSFIVQYSIVGETRYIQDSTEYVAADLGNETLNRFYDMLIAYINGLDANCLYNPTENE